MIPGTDMEAVGLYIDGLLAAGVTLSSIWDQEEDTPVATKEEAMALIGNLDMAHLHVTLPDGMETGWLFFVCGNDPIEVLCDHTVNLSSVIDPISDPWWNR